MASGTSPRRLGAGWLHGVTRLRVRSFRTRRSGLEPATTAISLRLLEPFKNAYSPELVGWIAYHLDRLLPGFDRAAFEQPVLAELEALELKARAQLIADHLHVALPVNHEERTEILLAMLHPDEHDHSGADSDAEGICGWGVMPLTMVVGQHGVAHFDESLAALREMTKRFTSEFAVRYFLLADQARALEVMAHWLDDPNQHVRRLVSEGTRPRLPWAMRLPQLVEDPAPVLPMLTALRDDDEEYVRRSVANNLNDMTKDHPDLVAGLAAEWMSDADKNRERLLRHACRSLIKAGHPGALAVFGFSEPEVELESLSIESEKVRFGNAVVFAAKLTSTSRRAQPLIVDYVIHFQKANGKQAPKVFKWTKLTLDPGESRQLERSHPIRKVTTRRYYDGEHAVSLRINGRDCGFAGFLLEGAE